MGPPKGAKHTVSAKLTEPDGVEWALEAWAYELPGQPVVELDDCGSGTHRISTSFPDIDPEPSEPESFPIELTVEWGEGFERSTVTRSEIVVLPGP